MTPREIILERIRKALGAARTPTVRRRTVPPPADRVAAARSVLPAVPDDIEGRAALFAERAALLRATFERVADRAALAQRVAELARAGGWKRAATHEDPLCEATCAAAGVEWAVGRADDAALAACDVGVTRCEALIAQTGSVLVSSRSSGGRTLSVLPPHHVVLATRGQLVADLFAGYELVRTRYGDDWPSMLSVITGPSRTGDIERTLVLGAHGPRELTIFMLERDDA